MRRLILPLLAGAGLLASSAPAKQPASQLAILGTGAGTLVRVDPGSLKRVGSRSLFVGPFTTVWALSPGRSRAVLAENDHPTLRFLDTRRLRRLGDLRLDFHGFVL